MPQHPSRGFTLIEALVVVAIMAILAAVAAPSMSNWLLGRKAMAAAVFYQEGFAAARNAAIAHSSHSRLVLSENTANGKLDWRIDICFPKTGTVCDDNNTTDWSTTTASAANDPDTATAKFKSIERSAQAMPNGNTLQQTVTPSGATAIYFTQMGWVDGTITPRVTSMDLKPALARTGAFKPIALVVPLSGIAVICDRSAPAHDVRGCPP